MPFYQKIWIIFRSCFYPFLTNYIYTENIRNIQQFQKRSCIKHNTLISLLFFYIKYVYSELLAIFYPLKLYNMRTIKWYTPPTYKQTSSKSLNKQSQFHKYCSTIQKGLQIKQNQLVRNSRQRVQKISSTQKKFAPKTDSKLSGNINVLIKNQLNESSIKKIKAKFPIEKAAQLNNKVQYKTYIRSLLKQIKQIVQNLAQVFDDVDNMLKQLQKTFNYEIENFLRSNLKNKFQQVCDLSKIKRIKMSEKDQTIKSFSFINHNECPQTIKKLSYNSQKAGLQTQKTLKKMIKNSCMPTQITEFNNTVDCNRTTRKNNLLEFQKNSFEKRESSIQLQMKKLKGVLGNMKKMLHNQ